MQTLNQNKKENQLALKSLNPSSEYGKKRYQVDKIKMKNTKAQNHSNIIKNK
jgi:hypothetical protein